MHFPRQLGFPFSTPRLTFKREAWHIWAVSELGSRLLSFYQDITYATLQSRARKGALWSSNGV